ncbi:lysophosphatidylcholine acyltransferase isoform X2 [Neodiprion pinetum]|uniref:Lysophosphatidylcholine acyltransferase isoform X1 n=1 Tax=Neodiprion lecontei TaxID=441921 RepID=A0ABM3FLQ6_NEOLC|nr:lysophosphatidylcholine acyltransferase isoform X1 [Neodiprion pinetum]XP_046588956.1 lysophosphatidylcholine acyltransferase isoform X1 [Neodiprion lecontei]
METMERMNGKVHQTSDSPSVSADILNPFVHRLELDTTYDKLKTAFLTVAVLPFRLVAITALVILAWLLACLGLHGLTEDDLRRAPLTGWRRDLRVTVCWVLRASFVCGGFHHLKVKGHRAPAKDAPVLALAPHSSFFDALTVVHLGGPSVVAKAETSRLPFFGKLINYTQPVYVWREDPNSRQNTIKEIIERATSKEDWPQVMIFPEGTCTNRSCLITFKSGAFYPGVPIQPVCIRYPNKLDTVTWTWEGPGALKLLWLTLTQLNSSCEIEFLPVYKPSEAEKSDPKLYANNVRRLMARALQIPVSDYTYDDCRIISKAHQLNLKHVSTIIEAHKLRYKLGLLQGNIEETLVKSKTERLDEIVDLYKFAKILRVDEKDPATRQLFHIHDWDHCDKINLEEYVFTVLVIAKADTIEEMIKLAFEICNPSETPSVDANTLRRILSLCLHLSPEESDKIFRDALTIDRTRVKLEDLIELLSKKTEFMHLFATHSEEKRKKVI